MLRVSAILLATTAAAAASSASAQGITSEQVAKGFAEGVSAYCVKAVLSGSGVAGLPAADRAGVSPASEDARFLVRMDNPTGPIWNVESAKGVVVLSEPKPGRCDVVAYGPPVASTFALTRAEAKRLYAAVVEGPRSAKDKLFDEQLTVTQSGATANIKLWGQEPGAPGRMFRFPLMNAQVTAAAKTE